MRNYRVGCLRLCIDIAAKLAVTIIAEAHGWLCIIKQDNEEEDKLCSIMN